MPEYSARTRVTRACRTIAAVAAVATASIGMGVLPAHADDTTPGTYTLPAGSCLTASSVTFGDDGAWTMNLDDPATTGGAETIVFAQDACANQPITSVRFTGNADGHVKKLDFGFGAFAQSNETGSAFTMREVHFPAVKSINFSTGAFAQYQPGIEDVTPTDATLETIEFPEGIETLNIAGWIVFGQYGEANPNLPGGLRCPKLQSVVFPRSLKSLDVGVGAFAQMFIGSDCESTLREVDIPSTQLEHLSLGVNAFGRVHQVQETVTPLILRLGFDETTIPASLSLEKQGIGLDAATDYVVWNGVGAPDQTLASGLGTPAQDIALEGSAILRFDAGEGTGAPAPVRGPWSLDDSQAYKVQIPRDVPTREGYTFTGWNMGPLKNVKPGTGLKLGAFDTTATAVWEKAEPTNVYTVPSNTCGTDGPVSRGDDGSWTFDLNHESLKDKDTVVISGWQACTDNPIRSVHFVGNSDGHIKTLDIGERAFLNNDADDQGNLFLTEVQFPVVDNLIIGTRAFGQEGELTGNTPTMASLKKVEFPEGILNLDVKEGAFAQIPFEQNLAGWGCPALKEVRFPESLTSLKTEQMAFTQMVFTEGCTDTLQRVDIPGGNLDTLDLGIGTFMRSTNNRSYLEGYGVLNLGFDEASLPTNTSIHTPLVQAGKDYVTWNGKTYPSFAKAGFTATGKDQAVYGSSVLSFDPNGGSGGPQPIRAFDAPYEDVAYEVTIPTEKPTFEGRTFEGWDAGIDQLLQPGMTIALGQDRTVKASWKLDTHTVTFDTQGGSAIESTTVEYGKTVSEPSDDPALEGSRFVGWFADAEGETPFDFDAPVTADVTVYAKWEKTPDPYQFIRYSGKYRMDTARLANEDHPATGDIVFIATAYNFPDALAVAPAAAKNNAALYLIKPEDGIDAKTMDAIAKSTAKEVYILGGKLAVPLNVEDQLATIDKFKDAGAIHRFAGKDRAETSTMIAKKFFPGAKEAFIATGMNFPDALAGGSLAAYKDAPILLVDPTKATTLNKGQVEALKDAKTVTLLGGPTIVPETFANGFAFDRISGGEGGSRFDTAANISKRLPATAKAAWVVTGRNYPDALIASSIAGRNFEPVLLSERDQEVEATAKALERFTDARIRYTAGGQVAILDEPAKVGFPEEAIDRLVSDPEQ